MSSVYCPLRVMSLKSSLRRTAAPIPVSPMAFPPSGIVSMHCGLPLRGSCSRHRLGAGGDRLHDVVVARAAADIALELLADRLVVEIAALAADHIDRGHDHAGRAETALQAVILAEGLLHRMQLAVLREPLDRGDVRALDLPGEDGAGLDRLAVDVDDACATLRGVAPHMGTSQTQALAQVLDQQRAGIRVGGDGFAVHRHRDLGHRPSSSETGAKGPRLVPESACGGTPGAKSWRFCRKSLIGTRTTLNPGQGRGQVDRAP